MLSFFPRGVLDEILNLIESVSEGFPFCSYFCYSLQFIMQNRGACSLKKCFHTERAKGKFVRENLKKQHY